MQWWGRLQRIHSWLRRSSRHFNRDGLATTNWNMLHLGMLGRAAYNSIEILGCSDTYLCFKQYELKMLVVMNLKVEGGTSRWPASTNVYKIAMALTVEIGQSLTPFLCVCNWLGQAHWACTRFWIRLRNDWDDIGWIWQFFRWFCTWK